MATDGGEPSECRESLGPVVCEARAEVADENNEDCDEHVHFYF